MVMHLLLSSKVPEERRAATRYGASVALRLDWGELCGKRTKEEREGLEGKVKYCAIGEEHGIPVPSCSSASTTGQCFFRRNACASAKSDQLETEGGGGQTEGGVSSTLVLHTNPSSTAKIHDFILSQYCAVLCYSLWGCCCRGFPMVLHSSTL